MNRVTKTFPYAFLGAVALGLLVLSPAACADPMAAPAKVEMVCANCHGVDGVAVIPGAANLSGQQREYLVAQLRAFRGGVRREPQMSVVAKTLSDADIDALASWYASIKVTVQMPK